MLTDFTTRVDGPAESDTATITAGTRIYLRADPDYPGLESAVIAALDAEGVRRLGLVPGDDKHRLFTRMLRGSIVTAKASPTQTSRTGLDIDVHVEDFGGGSAPSANELLPARPPRRTALVEFHGDRFQRVSVKDWARQLLAKVGEAENRGEDLKAFAQEQEAEIQRFAQQLPADDRAEFWALLREEVDLLENAPPELYWMIGETTAPQALPPPPTRWLRWVVVLAAAAMAYTWLTA